MLVRTNKLLLREKTEEKGISQQGREYTRRTLYLKAETGELYQINFVNDYIFNNCEENKNYFLEYNLDTKGKIELNDIIKA